jgi:sulfonate transport system substrate-binding protein
MTSTTSRPWARRPAQALLAAALGLAGIAAHAQDGRPVLRVSAQNKDALETFRESGVLNDAPYRVSWSLLPTATEESAALLANSVDLNVMQGTISVTLQQGSSRESWAGGKAPVTIIAAHSPRDDANYKSMVTIVKPDGPIRQASDLKGRSITFKEGGNMYTQALLSVEHGGLKASDVRLVNLSPADGLVAFRSGSVDALTNNPGRLKPLLDTGRARLLLTNTEVGFPASTATVVRTADLNDPRKVEIFRDFVIRIQQWNDWKATHTADVEKILVDITHLKPDDAAYNARASISDVVIVDDAFFKTEQHIADVVAQAGGIPKPVDVRIQYDTRFNDDIARARKLNRP